MDNTTNNCRLPSNVVLGKIRVGLEYFRAERKTSGITHDIDLFALLLDGDGKINDERDVVFYNNCSDSNHIAYSPPDDELPIIDSPEDDRIYINLKNSGDDIARILLVVVLYDAINRKQSFSDLTAFYMYTSFAADESKPIAFEHLPHADVMLLCEFIKENGEWTFECLGNGYKGGISQLLLECGMAL